jgi:hypothetical protein
VKEHFSSATVDRVEWIDDTSANLLFSSNSTAAEALVALSTVEIADPTHLPSLELLPAKPYSAKPDVALQMRFAIAGDRKQAGAAARSRFYLLHPEYDPEERRRRGEFDNRRYRDRDGGYRRGNRRRRDSEEREVFDVSLYDDDEEALAKRATHHSHRREGGSRSRSRSRSRSDEDRRRRNRDRELFPNHEPKRNGDGARNRSASPQRSDLDMDDAAERMAASRNRERARAIKERWPAGRGGDNSTKELFPSNKDKELFPAAEVGSKAEMDKVDPADSMTQRLSGMSISPSVNSSDMAVLCAAMGQVFVPA